MNTVASKWVIGMDVSEKSIEFFFLRPDGEGGLSKKEPNSPDTLAKLCSEMPDRQGFMVVMENGTHSPWMSEYFQCHGVECYVGNARKLAAIWTSVQKSDRNDAEMLARLARADLKLFSPIRHAGRDQRAEFAVLKSRDRLVKCRTALINCVRGTLRSFGVDTSELTVEKFTSKAVGVMPKDLHPALDGMLVQIRMLETQIKDYDRKIERIGKRHEPVQRLRQISGVGPVIALAYVLFVGDPQNYSSAGRVGAHLGIVPKRDQSGDVDKQLGITKAGNQMLRYLLAQGANYILSRGPDCDLRRFGERICARGGKIARRKAKIAVARKLSKIMYVLWRNGADYELFHKSQRVIVNA